MITEQENILYHVKQIVKKIIPDGTVMLFGSRVTGNWHSESDWDFIILTESPYPKHTRWQLIDALQPFEIANGQIFSIMIITKNEWEHSPQYYSLFKGVGDNFIVL